MSLAVAQHAARGSLTRDETMDLVRRGQAGDSGARDVLVRHNLKFIVQVATKLKGPADLEDRVAAGMVGFNRAIDTFDPERGVVLLTYAVHWIRVHVQQEHHRSTAVRGGWAPKNGGHRGPWLFPGLLSLDAPVADEGGETFADVLRAEESDPLAPLAEQQQRERVAAALAQLDPREQRIIRARYLDEREGVTLEELGVEMGFSRERARQLEMRALEKLRAILGSEEPPPAPPPAFQISKETRPMTQMEKAAALAQRIREGEQQLEAWKRELAHLLEGASAELDAIREVAGVKGPRRRALPPPSVPPPATRVARTEPGSRGDRVLAFLRQHGPARAPAIAAGIGDRTELVAVQLQSLVARKLARRVERGVYEAEAAA